MSSEVIVLSSWIKILSILQPFPHRKKELLMEDCLHTSSENLSKLVRWAHSHGTICSLIPGLKHVLTEGSHGNLTAMW